MNFQIFLDNIVYSIQKYGGATTYWKELQKYFIELEDVKIITQATNEYNETTRKDKFIFENILPPSILRYLPLTKRLPAKSLYHASYYRTCLQKNVTNIFTVHDFTHYKGYASKFPRKLVHITLNSLGLRNADGIICISENTKRDLMYYFPQIKEDMIRVIYHGVSDDFFPLQGMDDNAFISSLKLDSPFVVFVGKRQGYKKFSILPEALKKTDNIKLVIVGGGALTSPEIEELENTIPGRYIKIDNINNGDLNILYNRAFALIYPSIYEGFGFPVVEAMKAGCPVITTNLSSIPEVGGDAALMLNEVSSQALFEQMEFLRNPDARASLINKGFIQSKKFTWKKCFSETLQFYNDIYQKKFDL